MAIAVMPEGPKDRSERFLTWLAVAAMVLIVALFVYAMLDAYVL